MLKNFLLIVILAAGLSGCAVYEGHGPYGHHGSPGYYDTYGYQGGYDRHMGCGHYWY